MSAFWTDRAMYDIVPMEIESLHIFSQFLSWKNCIPGPGLRSEQTHTMLYTWNGYKIILNINCNWKIKLKKKKKNYWDPVTSICSPRKSSEQGDNCFLTEDTLNSLAPPRLKSRYLPTARTPGSPERFSICHVNHFGLGYTSVI